MLESAAISPIQQSQSMAWHRSTLLLLVETGSTAID
jgi:hypothetical protein